MNPRYEAVQFRPAEIPTPVEGQEYDLRLWPGKVGYAVLDHETREVIATIHERPSTAMREARRLNDGGPPSCPLSMGPFYYNQLKKWSAHRDTPAL